MGIDFYFWILNNILLVFGDEVFKFIKSYFIYIDLVLVLVIL